MRPPKKGYVLLEKNGNVEKVCKKCNVSKLLLNFGIRSNKKDGRNNVCSECCKKSYKKKICELCNVIIDIDFIKTYNTKNYKKIHGFCRQCRKKLRKMQELYGGKTCTKCNLSKPFGDFPHHKHTYDNFDSWCKLCRKNYKHEINQSLDTHIRKKLRMIKEDRRKLENNLDLQFLIDLWNQQNGKCAISGKLMSHKANPRMHNLTNGSLDRIDSKKPYFKNNVQWVCWIVNRMKGENSVEDLLEWCKIILKHKKTK